MCYEFLLLDIDDTVLDFKSAERNALLKTHRELGLPCETADCELFHDINISLWKEFERGVISEVDDIFVVRFNRYLKARGLTANACEMRIRYENNLAERGDIKDGVLETLEYLKDRARIFSITNGVAKSQINRLKISGTWKYFEKNFFSGEIGYRKPDKRFFDYVEANIDGFNKTKALLVGDSLSADVTAGKFGFDVCWLNSDGNWNENAEVKPKFVITKFSEIKNFFAREDKCK